MRFSSLFFFGGIVSLAEKAKADTKRFTDLNSWLESLPKPEQEGAIFMLSTPSRWSVVDLLAEFREDARAERGEELLFGKDHLYRWRKVNGVSR